MMATNQIAVEVAQLVLGHSTGSAFARAI